MTDSLLDAEAQFSPELEQRFRAPKFCLSTADLVIEDGYWLAERVVNEQVLGVLAWLKEVVDAPFPAVL